jgi:hypothetical protein
MNTTYERFVQANQKLIKCFDAVPADKYNKLSSDEQGALCSSEKKVVQTFLASNELSFSNLLRERINIVNNTQ